MEFQYYGNFERQPRRLYDQPWWDEEDNLTDRHINVNQADSPPDGKRKTITYKQSYASQAMEGTHSAKFCPVSRNLKRRCEASCVCNYTGNNAFQTRTHLCDDAA
ncbi:jg14864 [Pararge aegeria aegeria]|uniref:Jg14864 protein n=1 Tax=Pararge aegeria aegeria TaxID=348720 RepID=A0A8S4R3T3_9NEOP|nr:jg14864 [Pararge aegeria aegeria]